MMQKKKIDIVNLIEHIKDLSIKFEHLYNDSYKGSYIEEDGDESELFTLVVNGENIFMIVTVYGQVVGAHEFTYNLDGDVITLHPRANDSLYDEMETAYFDKNSGRITWDGITYILGSVYPLW